ncbi:hypothetical protein F2Q68_00023832 [Brassica cretica]|uniref:F-box domain-containing protein n=1 Tax=Brassica cretica TaxID=69181 RepID=A0A8S9IHC9_BRACR|nr:hypothetical protein F2Q68_00023832 [Brassica cretica]
MRCRDSISKLPDEILGKILSLVPTKVAASTSVLSKRWRNLMVLVDNLCFDESMAFHFCCESMPVFNNLLNLSIESHKKKGWQVMPLLLKSCPNLHALAMKGLVHRVTNKCGDACACSPKKNHKHKKMKIVKEEKVCCLESCQVKVLKISEYGGSFQELKQMKHFLGKLKCLETVKVCFNANNNNEFLQANLMALPRASSECNLQFL